MTNRIRSLIRFILDGNEPGAPPFSPWRAQTWVILGGVVAAALLAWLLGLWLAWDVLGETARHAITFIAGGGLSALIIALHGRLRIVPILGPLLTIACAIVATIAGIVAAVFIVRHLLLYAAGAAPWWPIAACLAVFVVVAVGISVCLLSLVALGAAMLRKRRNRSGAIPALGPLLVGVIAGPVALTGMLYSPSGEYVSLWHLSNAPRRSVWYEARQALFSDILDGYKCDVIVVPIEAPVNSIDRNARDLIARTLAVTIADGTGLCVVDFDLARRALGEQRRAIAWNEVYRLADRVQARWIVRGTASTASNGTAALVEFNSFSRANPSAPWQALSAIQWPRQAVSDAVPPELVFLKSMPDVPAELGFTVKAIPETLPPAPTRVLPETPEGLLADTPSPIDRAERLQLMASMLFESMPEAESLWVRSLVALRRQPETDPDARALRARAWLYLNRRRYAEQLVTGVGTPEAKAVLELTRGNLDAAATAAKNVSSPIARLIDEIGVEWIRSAYSETLGYEKRRNELMTRHPTYAEFLYQTLGTGDWGGGEALAAAYAGLARRGVDASEHWTRGLLRAAFRFVLRIDPFALLPQDPAGAIQQTYDPQWRARASTWRLPVHDRLAERDLFEVLYAINRRAIEQHLEMRTDKQGLYEVTVTEALMLAPELRSNPRVLSRTLRALRFIGADKPDFIDHNRRGAATEFAKHILAAEDGETGTAFFIAGMHGIDSPWVDEPPHPWQAVGGWARQNAVISSRAEAERDTARYQRAALLARTGFRYVSVADDYLRRLGRTADADAWLEANANRFDGDPARVKFERLRIERIPEPERQLALLRPRIEAGTSNWGYYYDAALAELRLRHPVEAQRILQSWPGFRTEDASPVGLSNTAGTIGQILMRTGETALARVWAQRSVDYRTGAGAEMVAQALLGVIGHDWIAAREAERESFDRYKSATALGRAAWLAFLAGKTSDGKADAVAAVNRGSGMVGIRALSAGARMESADPGRWTDEIAAKIEPGEYAADVPWWLAFDLYFVDRKIDDAAVAQVLSRARVTSPANNLLIKVYADFRRRDWAAMLASLPRIYAPRTDATGTTYYTITMALPMYGVALARSGRVEDARKLADQHLELMGSGRYFHMTMAIVEEAEGRRTRALEHLWQAFPDTVLEHPDAIHPTHQLLEIAEFLYESTGDERYRTVMADVATRYARSWPISWAYAFAARYGKTAEARRDAAMAVLYLDPNSMRLNALPASELEYAKQLFAKRNPMLVVR